jgi:hypothetical protein
LLRQQWAAAPTVLLNLQLLPLMGIIDHETLVNLLVSKVSSLNMKAKADS